MTREELIQELRGRTVEIGDTCYSSVASDSISIIVQLTITDPERLISQLIQQRLLTENELDEDSVIETLCFDYDYELEPSDYGLAYESWYQD